LDEDGVFKVLQMVNRYAIPKPLNEEVVLKKAFIKWWPDLETELDQMEVREQSEKSSRAVPEMLKEILGIVRSIDKAANRTSPAPVWYGAGTAGDPFPILPYAEFSGQLTSIADLERASELTAKLVTEVQKTNPSLAKALSAGFVAFNDQTLTLNIQHMLFSAQGLEPAYKAATSLGISLKIVHRS
jgi:hypothetical protein